MYLLFSDIERFTLWISESICTCYMIIWNLKSPDVYICIVLRDYILSILTRDSIIITLGGWHLSILLLLLFIIKHVREHLSTRERHKNFSISDSFTRERLFRKNLMWWKLVILQKETLLLLIIDIEIWLFLWKLKLLVLITILIIVWVNWLSSRVYGLISF